MTKQTSAVKLVKSAKSEKLKKDVTSSVADVAVCVTGAHKPVLTDVKQIEQAYPFDRLIHAEIGKATSGLSPISLAMAFYDWAAHLSIYPSKRSELVQEAFKNALLFSTTMTQAASKQEEKSEPIIRPQPRDYRFKADAWQNWPFNAYYQGFLLA